MENTVATNTVTNTNTTPAPVTRASRKIVKKAKVNKYTKEDCVKELARLAETHSELSKYGDDIRDRLAELK